VQFFCCTTSQKPNYFTQTAERGSEQPNRAGLLPSRTQASSMPLSYMTGYDMTEADGVVQSFQALCLQILHGVAVEHPAALSSCCLPACLPFPQFPSTSNAYLSNSAHFKARRRAWTSGARSQVGDLRTPPAMGDSKSCTIRTRKFLTNRLLDRKQFVSATAST
jgi:hypothetical protein